MKKKLFSIILAAVLVIMSFSGCKKTDTAKDETSSDTSVVTESGTVSGEQVTEPETGESTSEATSEDTTESGSTPAASETTGNSHNNTPNNNTGSGGGNKKPTSGGTTANKPSNSTPTTPNNPTTPTNPPASQEKASIVSVKLVSVERRTKFKVDGQYLLDRLYGTNKCFQAGDVITYDVVMSDGSDNWSIDHVFDSLWLTSEKRGKQLVVTVNDNSCVANEEVIIQGANKVGYGVAIQITSIHSAITPTCDETLYTQIRDYGIRLGMKYEDGPYFADKSNRMHFSNKIPNNPNWIAEVLHAMDNWKASGCTHFGFVLVYEDGFDGNAI